MKPEQDNNLAFDNEEKISSTPVDHSNAGLLDENPLIENEDNILLD